MYILHTARIYVFRTTVILGEHSIYRQLQQTGGGRNSSVGIATRYGLDGPEIESRSEARFSAPVQTGPWGLLSLLYNGYRVFPGGKAAGAW